MKSRTKDVEREFLLPFWKLHILHHAGEEAVVGQWIMRELRRHGYEVSPGTLYPLLARMQERGWLRSKSDPEAGLRARKEYTLTKGGKSVLKLLRRQLEELYREVVLGEEEHSPTEAPLMKLRRLPWNIRKILSTAAPGAVVIVRLMVGAVFLSEGIQKFLFPADVGVGRFTKIGLPAPGFLAPFVGTFEIVCGALLLLGLLTRVAAVPLIAIMLTAISTTKLPIFMSKGFWAMAHEARTDWSMLLGSLYLLIVGAGAWSVDAALARRKPD